MTPLARVAIAGRVFCIAAILGVALVDGDAAVWTGLVALTTVGTAAVYLGLATPMRPGLVIAMESVVAGLILGLSLRTGVILLPYLVVILLIAGMTAGVVGVSTSLLIQLAAFGVAAGLSTDLDFGQFLTVLSPWLLTGIGVGLLGSWLRGVGKVSDTPDDEATYAATQRLLTQLRTLARRLSSGLDPVSIAEQLMDTVQTSGFARECAVLVSTGGSALSPLTSSGEGARELAGARELIRRCWSEAEPVAYRVEQSLGTAQGVFIPLRAGSRMVGVLAARTETVPTPAASHALMLRLDEHALRLETALIFDEVRSLATREERQRLAREIHDGIAQDVASLGYHVDDLLAEATSRQQQERLTGLRQEVTRVVSELRLSIFDLRNDVSNSGGLGAALSDYVRQVGSQTDLTVHLILDESPDRLRPEIEMELLRIAQEAIANARKHSGAKNLWVECRTDPPFARLTIQDDGVGLSPGRSDSYGLRIMQERADRIQAQLEVVNRSDEASGTGTTVRVTARGRAANRRRPKQQVSHDV